MWSNLVPPHQTSGTIEAVLPCMGYCSCLQPLVPLNQQYKRGNAMAGIVPGWTDLNKAKKLAELIWHNLSVEVDKEAMICNVQCQQNDPTKRFTISFDPIRRTNDWVAIIKMMARHGFTAVITRDLNNKVGGSVAFKWKKDIDVYKLTITHTDNFCIGRAVMEAAIDAIVQCPIVKEVKK